jgi:arylsulfatase A-like enzyme
MGHLGNPGARTPNLDRTVRDEAVSFRWAFCQNPVCTPSRYSFMTGWYPHVRGHRTMYHMLHTERGEPFMPKLLKDSGYFVWWGGKNDLVPGQNGYDESCDVKHAPSGNVHRDSRNVPEWRGPSDGDNYCSFYRRRLDERQ